MNYIYFANCDLVAICDKDLYPHMSKFVWYLSDDFQSYRLQTGKYGCQKKIYWNDEYIKLQARKKLRVVK